MTKITKMAKKRFSMSFFVPETNDKISEVPLARDNALKEYITKCDNEIKTWIDIKKGLIAESKKRTNQNLRASYMPLIDSEEMKISVKPSELKIWTRMEELDLLCDNFDKQQAAANDYSFLLLKSYNEHMEAFKATEKNVADYIKKFEASLCEKLEFSPDPLLRQDFELDSNDLRDDICYLDDYISD